jgi:hypothetical protein
MRGVGEACKRIQRPLLHPTKAHFLTASAVTLQALRTNVFPCTPLRPLA